MGESERYEECSRVFAASVPSNRVCWQLPFPPRAETRCLGATGPSHRGVVVVRRMRTYYILWMNHLGMGLLLYRVYQCVHSCSFNIGRRRVTVKKDWSYVPICRNMLGAPAVSMQYRGSEILLTSP